jgi:uncharacterized membrane protein
MGFLPEPLHPAVIHFPIALTMVALLLDLVSRHPRARSLEPGGALLMVLAALGGIAATLTGQVAEEDAVVPRAAKALLERHEELGEIAMWVLIAVALVRLVLAWRGAFRGVLAWLYLVLALGTAAAVGYQGYIGGELVFRYGVGTAPVQRQVPGV